MKIGIESNLLKFIFKDVYFITGTAYAGKSTMVKLLAEKFDGIHCGENYHDRLMDAISVERQPNLGYFQTMGSWQEFIGRTPGEYAAWIEGCAKEATELETIILIQLAARGSKIFVDTNIDVEILKLISDYNHVAVMLSPKNMSVERFFDRDDEEKKFLLEQINKAPDPGKAMENFRACLEKIHSGENYEKLAESGFFTYLREDRLSINETLDLLAKHFKLS